MPNPPNWDPDNAQDYSILSVHRGNDPTSRPNQDTTVGHPRDESFYILPAEMTEIDAE